MKAVKVLVLIIGMVCFSVQFAFSAAAPEGINEIMEEMSELEEGFEGGNWKESLEATEKIEKELKEVLEQSKLEAPELQIALAKLKASVKAENEESTEVQFIQFQKRFFTFLDSFDYDTHPLLQVIDKYINDEAVEAAEKKDFDEVASEMAEVGNLMKLAKPILTEKGVAEQEFSDMNTKIVATVKAAKQANDVEVNARLQEVKELYSSFLARAK